MHQVTVHVAKTNLSKLIKEALAGEEVIIAKGRNPLVRLQPLENARPARRIGGLKGLVIRMSDDFDAPLEDFKEYME